MTNDDVIFLSEVLPLVNVPDMEPDFNYAVSFNLREAEKIAVDINKAIEPKPGMEAYDKSAQELREEYAEKDPDGNAAFTAEATEHGPIRHYKIPGLEVSSSLFNMAVAKLKKKHEKDFKEREVQLEFLKKENKQIKLLEISKSDIPKGLSRRAMDAVFLFTKKPKK